MQIASTSGQPSRPRHEEPEIQGKLTGVAKESAGFRTWIWLGKFPLLA